MAELRDERVAAIRPLDRAEIERRVRDRLEGLLAGRSGTARSGLVPISAAELVRLAAPMTSRN
ncbi:MAG TPA: hypothetical protein VF139_18550 [Candidatus Polarisedimenticolaceae bacterium]